MSSFLYFKPNTTKPVTRDDVAAWGLDYAFIGKSVEGVAVRGQTPDGQPGHVFADPQRMGQASVRLDLDQQEWQELPGTEDIWLGMWRDAIPQPADLIRPRIVPGWEVRFEAGTWIVPLVRRLELDNDTRVPHHRLALPTVMRCGRDGRWKKRDVVARHAHLWDLTQPVADAMLAYYVDGTPLPELAEDEIAGPVVALLATNYVVGPGELSLLGELLAEAMTVQSAAMAANDWPTWAAWAEEQKKTESPPPPAG